MSAVGAQAAFYVYAEASVGSSKSNANSTTWQNTTLTGQNISLKAEGDTTLRGATATADRIDVKTGGTLTIESLLDVAESMSKNSQVGGRVQVSFGTAWSADGYASGGKSNGSYQGVGQQSGLFAGDGGYHVDAGHVNLVGGAIASTNATHSELTAQTLTFSDLQNQMQHSTSSGGISGGYGGRAENWKPTTEGATPNFGGGVPMNEKGGDSSTTYATLTEGNIVIGGQKVTAAELGVNTDAATAHRAIEAMPNAELQLANQQAMANAMGTVMATSKQIAGDIGNQAMRDLENSYLSTLSDEEKDRFKSQSAEGKSNELAARFPYSYSDAVAQQQNWGIGGDNSRALEAVTTLLVGAASGQGGGQMVANALAPYAANLIGDKFDTNHGSDPNAALQLLSHALLGALLAEANGGNAANGAGAATGGELAAKLLTEALYPGYTGELNDQQKQTILALSQAVGAVAGSSAGDGLAGAALAAGIAKNVVENNYLSAPQRKAKDADRAACGKDSVCLQATDARWAEVSQEQSRDVMERYAPYLTPDEQYVLFSLKPGTKEYDQILASAIAREASSQPPHLGTLLNREIGLLRETDWDGALFGPLAPGMSLTDRNRIEMALLGPIFGMPSATLTAFGVDPQTVAMTNQLGMLGWDIAGSGFIFRPKSTRGPANVDGGSTQVVLIQNSAGNLTKPTPTTGAPRNKIQLMDGFYVVDGLKISESYYERL